MGPYFPKHINRQTQTPIIADKTPHFLSRVPVCEQGPFEFTLGHQQIENHIEAKAVEGESQSKTGQQPNGAEASDRFIPPCK